MVLNHTRCGCYETSGPLGFGGGGVGTPVNRTANVPANCATAATVSNGFAPRDRHARGRSLRRASITCARRGSRATRPEIETRNVNTWIDVETNIRRKKKYNRKKKSPK